MHRWDMKKRKILKKTVQETAKRRQEENDLIASEVRYRRLFETAQDGILILDAETGMIVDVNPFLLDMLGYTHEHLLQKKVWELGFFKDIIANQETFLELQKKKYVRYEDKPLETRDGHQINVEFVSNVYEVDHHLVIQCNIRDITDRKLAEDRLRESQTRIRQLGEAALEGIAITEKGIVADANSRLTAMLGYSLDEMVGRPLTDFIAEDSLALVQEHIGASYELQYEHSLRRKNGSTFPVESHARIMTAKGKVMRVTALLDITERKRTEHQLIELRKAVDASGDAVFMTDRNGTMTFINPEFTRLYGYTKEEIVGKCTPRILKTGVTSSESYEKFWKAILSNPVEKREIKNKAKDGRVLSIESSVSRVIDESGKITGFLAIQRDVTERRRSEDALRHSQKLESIGTLAGGIAHDFNNLLNAVLGQSALALSKLPRESLAADNVTKAIKAAERATDLTRQLLAYSGKGKFVTVDFDLNRLVQENIQILEVSIPKTVQLKLLLDSSGATIQGDMGQIQQVIMNLIINAGEAIGSKPGTITIRTGRIEITPEDNHFWKYTTTSLATGKYVSLQVSDTGCGILPTMLARIFDPFFSTKFTGRGLGLAAVLGIIRGHNGGVGIESELGKGTTFEVVFPLVDGTVKADLTEKTSNIPIDGEGKTLLVIDDEPTVLELLMDVFTGANFKVIESLNPIEGVEMYREHQEKIAMVVLDFSMPGMDGKAAFEELTKINKNVRVLLCSGYSEEEMMSGFGAIRPLGFMKKPYKPSDLLERVSSMLL